MGTERNSMWRLMLPDLLHLVSDVATKSRITESMLLRELYRVVPTMDRTLGLSRAVSLRYAFTPLDENDHTNIKDMYENVDNISVGYYLYLTNSGSSGSIETKSCLLSDMQIALLEIFWNEEGSTQPPTLDISIDKDPAKGDEIRGTWLKAADRIPAIENGVPLDISMLFSSTFAVRWNFPSGSDYKIHDTIATLMLVNSATMYQMRMDIVNVAAYKILNREAAKAIKDGHSSQYIELIQEAAQQCLNDAKGFSPDGKQTPSTGAGATSHNYNRDYYADRAFRTVSSNLQPGERIIGLKGNLLDGLTIRYVNDDD
jgi:hypothetical protein